MSAQQINEALGSLGYCALIRVTGDTKEHAYLVEKYPLRIFWGNIFDGEGPDKNEKVDSLDSIIDDGWRVD